MENIRFGGRRRPTIGKRCSAYVWHTFDIVIGIPVRDSKVRPPSKGKHEEDDMPKVKAKVKANTRERRRKRRRMLIFEDAPAHPIIIRPIIIRRRRKKKEKEEKKRKEEK